METVRSFFCVCVGLLMVMYLFNICIERSEFLFVGLHCVKAECNGNYIFYQGL